MDWFLYDIDLCHERVKEIKRYTSEAYLRACQTSMMESFAKIYSNLKPLTILQKIFIIDV